MSNVAKSWQPRIVTDEEVLGIELGSSYERQLISKLCESPNLWSLIGTHLHPSWIKDKTCSNILTACKAISNSTGLGPHSANTVVRQLNQLHQEGKIAEKDFQAAQDLLINFDTSTCPAELEFVNQVSPLLRDRYRQSILDEMMSARAKTPDKDLTKFTRALNEVELIGRAQQVWNPADPFDESAWDRIDSLNRLERGSTGIPELDAELDGGLFRQSLIVWAGASNAGKSHAILNHALTLCQKGLRVIYVPTEQSVPANLVRAISWFTNDKTTDVINKNPATMAKWKRMSERPHGPIEFAFLPGGSTTNQLRQLIDHVLETNPSFGGGFDVLAVDIADRLKGNAKVYNSSYDCMGDVYEDLVSLDKEFNAWVITGSQLKDPKNIKGTPTHNDMADSLHKGRIADVVIPLWCDEDCNELRWYTLAKARDQRVGAVVGPLPTAFDRGQIYPRL